MSIYQPGIPTGTVNLDVDYQNVQNNFRQLDTSFGVDHVTFSNQTAQNGYHTSIHFNPFSTTVTNPPNNQPPVVPAAVAGYGQLFSSQINDGINTDTALYFLTGGNRLMQLTRNFAPVALQNGYTFLPGGLILQWARFIASGNTGTLTFAAAGVIPFPNNCFIVILQGDDNTTANENLLVTARTPTSFSFKSMNSGKAYTFLALGN